LGRFPDRGRPFQFAQQQSSRCKFLRRRVSVSIDVHRVMFFDRCAPDG
jgi:hypothetical protein